ncbi:roadblock/LC7 domain-containing protein [Methanoculleus sp. FWC-SCC1]|uniref:Roadblock/LC7 domain-containing protein n=1 Tax=Methanoculleus frigidifontis TaxID=2584085 RepID=A0ABT8M9R5_9EURY|nr:roadblock/LC7 domain-containing protein [Methanoculleus sp. FWC-SCC1]MDN7024673.1 roadblock/LC7 domain-containing protein [Methanoculleus sp. FWC-SCC1]
MGDHPSVGEKAQSYIDEVKSIDGIIACALVSQDGFVMGKYFRDDGHAPSLFAAMSATILASAEAAASAIHISSPSSVIVTTAEAAILVVYAGSEQLITAVVEKSADISAICEQIAAIAARFGEDM